MTHTDTNEVFVSYSRKDKVFAQKLVKRIYDSGRENIWIDWEDIEYAEDWWLRIRRGIESADNFVFILTPNSIRSEVCTDEVEHAFQSGKRIIPVMHIEPEDIQKENMHDAVKRHNWLPFRDEDDFEDSFLKLMNILEVDLQLTRTHTRLLTRAVEWDDANRDTGRLLTGSEIDEAETWLAKSANKDPVPTTLHTDYILASRKRQRTLARRMISAAVLAVLISLSLAVLAGVFGVEANHQANIALTAQAVAERSELEARSLLWSVQAERAFDTGDPSLAYQLAIVANSIPNPPISSQRTLADLIYAPGPRREFIGHDDRILDIAMSEDGQTLISSSEDGTIIVWDVVDGERLRTFEEHEDAVDQIALGRDGQNVISSSVDGVVMVWNTTSGEVLATRTIESGQLNALVMLHDESVALLAIDNAVFSWDPAQDELIQIFDEQSENIFSLTLSYDGLFLALGMYDGSVLVWNTATDTMQYTFDDAHSDWVRQTIFSTDNDYLVSVSDDGTAMVWNLETKEHERTFFEHPDSVWSVDISADSQFILTGGFDGELMLWELESGSLILTLKGHSDPVTAGMFLPGSQQMVSASFDENILLWDLTNGMIQQTFQNDEQGFQIAVLSDDGQSLVFGQNDGSITILDRITGVIQLNYQVHDSPIFSMAFSPDGHQVVTGALDGSLVISNIDDGQVVRQLPDFDFPIIELASDLMINNIAIALPDGRLYLWNINQPDETTLLTSYAQTISNLAISPDGQYLAVAQPEGFVEIWNLVTRERSRFEAHNVAVNSVDFDGTGQFALSGDVQGGMFVWQVEGQEIIADLSLPASGEVHDVALSEDGALALASVGDSTIIIQDVTTQSIVRQLDGIDSPALQINLSANNGYILSVYPFNQEVMLWQLANYQEMIDWGLANRWIDTIDCDEQVRYSILDMPELLPNLSIITGDGC